MAKFIKIKQRYGEKKQYSREVFLNMDFIVEIIDLMKDDEGYYSQLGIEKLTELRTINDDVTFAEATAEEILKLLEG